MPKAPSFILFITDQQQAGMLGCAGNPVVQTPHIDAMAATGTRFDGFHVAMPSCMPNRASLMSGLYPSVNGVRFNGIPLPQEHATFPMLFQQAGYRTGLMGKGHLQPIFPPYDADMAKDQTWWQQELASGGAALSPPYYGYDAVSIVTGHGDGCRGHYENWLAQKLPDFRDYQGADNQLPHNYSCPQAVRTRIPEELYPTSYIAQEAINFLETQSTRDEPFLLVVSFPDPHHPFNPPGKYWEMYDPQDVILPANFAAPDHDLPHLAAVRQARDSQTDNRAGYGAIALDAREAREAIALTYGMITMIDDAIGQVRQKLVELGLADHTVQMFTSDHGDLLGDHGLMLKGPLHYQSLIRVPFILSDPENPVADGVNGDLFSSLDIGATLLERAGLDVPAHLHGQSILQTLSGDIPARDSLLIEDEYQSPVPGFSTAPVLRTLRTKNWRMTVFQDQSWGELYDLATDPDETRNLWHDPAFADQKADLLCKLAGQMMAIINRKTPARSLA